MKVRPAANWAMVADAAIGLNFLDAYCRSGHWAAGWLFATRPVLFDYISEPLELKQRAKKRSLPWLTQRARA